MKMFTVENVMKTYADKTLFQHISFTIKEGERIGIIGINGTGKTTLLKIIVGIEQADEGELLCPKDYTIGYLPQHPDYDDNRTMLEQVFHGDTPLIRLLKLYEIAVKKLEHNPTNETYQTDVFRLQREMDAADAWGANANAEAILSKLGLSDTDRKIGELSGGQKRRVALAQALIEAPDLLVLDEPTNHLDYATIRWLEDYLGKYQGTVLIVTHDRYFLDAVTNRMFELDKKTLYSYKGNYADFLEGKALREEQEKSTEAKKQNLYRRELAWIRRGAKARTTKQKARIDRFDVLEDSLGSETKTSLDIQLTGNRLGKKVIELTDINKSFGSRKVLENFSLLLKPHDRIGIVGDNGSGKSTLLNILSGRINQDSGEMDVGQTVKVGYYTQESIDMDENKRMIEYVKEVADSVKTDDGFISVSQMLERFLFPLNTHGTPIRKLSGGERRRLYLLKILMEEPNVLLLDEPTNDLDTESLTVLEDYLQSFPGVVVTVSHDRYFLDKIAEQLLIFQNGTIERYFGEYTDYLEKTSGTIQETEPKKIVPRTQEKRTRRLSYKEQKEWEEIEQHIEEKELQLAEITEEMEKSSSNYGKVQELSKQHEELSTQLDVLMERWSELSDLVEEST